MAQSKLSRTNRDIVIALAVVLGLFAVFSYYDVFEQLHQITREHEDWNADEFVVLMLALPLPLAWFGYRRIREIQRNAEQQIAMESMLAHSRKLESLGTLAGGVAHEINNQLTPVLTMTELMLDSSDPADPQHRKLSLIHKGASNAREPVLKIKEFSRQGEDDSQSCEVGETLNYCRDLVKHLVPSTITVSFALNDIQGLVSMNSGNLEAVVINLVSNAVDAMGGNLGAIRIEAERIESGQAPTLKLALGKYVCIRVTDSGSGIDEESIKRVFDPFFTTKKIGKGMGVGLSIVHSMVHRAGGDITVASVVGEGSVFTAYLPLIDAGEQSGATQTNLEGK